MKKKWSGAQSDIIQKKNSSRIREVREDDTRFGSQFDATLQVKVIRTLSSAIPAAAAKFKPPLPPTESLAVIMILAAASRM